MKYEAHITLAPGVYKYGVFHQPRGWKYSYISGWDGGQYLSGHGNNKRKLKREMRKLASRFHVVRMKIEEIVYDVRRPADHL